jgi:hypothetical protein
VILSSQTIIGIAPKVVGEEFPPGTTPKTQNTQDGAGWDSKERSSKLQAITFKLFLRETFFVFWGFFVLFCFVFLILGFELRACTLSYFTSTFL